MTTESLENDDRAEDPSATPSGLGQPLVCRALDERGSTDDSSRAGITADAAPVALQNRSDAAVTLDDAVFLPPTIGKRQPPAEVPPKLATGRPGLADTMIDAGSFGSHEIRAASVRGAAPRYYGEHRQDTFALDRSADGAWLIVAVADGVSSAPNADRGARAAATGACRAVTAALHACAPHELDWLAVVQQVADEVLKLGMSTIEPAADESEELVDRAAASVATTLTIALIPAGTDGSACICAIGDSPVWLLANGTWRRASGSGDDGADVASTATNALPRVPGKLAPTWVPLVRGDVLVVMSDGVGDPLFDGQNDVGDYLAIAWTRPPPLLKFAADVQFRRKGWDDDRTAVAVWIDVLDD